MRNDQLTNEVFQIVSALAQDGSKRDITFRDILEASEFQSSSVRKSEIRLAIWELIDQGVLTLDNNRSLHLAQPAYAA